ncbi:ABC transporter permease subunit [Candidatus Bipolaricaulota bacterium]|nr:ABC transporter permease subunit [Candidatus Bipolaricaulota bacterium]
MKSGISRYLISLLFLTLLWWLAAFIVRQVVPGPKSMVLSGPIKAFSMLFYHWNAIWPNFLRSALRLVISLLISVFLGATTGLIIGFEKPADRLLSPMIYIAYPIPKIVFLPVILILFGLGDLSRIVFIVLVITFQVALSSRDAAKNISNRHVKAVESAGGSRLQVYRHVVIPAALPAILTSVRISIGLGIAALYLAEESYTNQGLAYYINNSWKIFAYSDVFAGILAFAILGLGLYLIVDLIERIFCKWNYIA